MKRKIIRVFLFLVFLEGFLRLGGFVSLCIQDYQNHSDSNSKHTYRILCVGESMTMLGGDSAYPKQLEIVLNQRVFSKKFQVINKGIAGVTTDSIVGSMESYIKEYKPDMVIVMMGINDASSDPFMVQELGVHGAFFNFFKFFYELRVCKLFRGTYKDLNIELSGIFHYPVPDKGPAAAPKAKSNTIYDERPDYSQGPSDMNTAKMMQLGLMSILAKHFSDAERVFQMLIEDPKAKIYNSKLTFYHYLALIQYQESKTPELMLTLEQIPYGEWYDIPVINLCRDPENAGDVTASLKDLNEEFPNIPFYSDMIYQCYERSGNSDQAGIWKEKALHLKNSQVNIRTKSNYLKLLEILKKDHIMPVLMQYPLQELGLLKSMVHSALGNEWVIFIDNEGVFKEAVAQAGYDAVFSDHSAGDFGHPTPQGNRIIAENAAQTLITAMHWK